MPPWLYALTFIVVLLAVAWTVDRRQVRVRRSRLAITSGPARHSASARFRHQRD